MDSDKEETESTGSEPMEPAASPPPAAASAAASGDDVGVSANKDYDQQKSGIEDSALLTEKKEIDKSLKITETDKMDLGVPMNVTFKLEGKQKLSSLAPTEKAVHDLASEAMSSSWGDDSSTSIQQMDTGIGTDVTLLGGVLGRENLTSGLEDVVGIFLRQGAYVGLGMWVSLLGLMFLVAPLDSYQYMNGTEQIANTVLLTLLIGVNLNRLIPLFVNDRNWAFLKSGAMTTSFIVQSVAIASVAAMRLLPTPVIVDPNTGLRFHLVRWAEWTALAFLMTFLTESIDLPLEGNNTTTTSWLVATTLAVSTFCGVLLPFCPGKASWMTALSLSWALFMILPIRLIQKRNRLLKMPKGDTTTEKENYERARFSVKLYIICTILWTILALLFTACCIGKVYAPPDSIWANDALVLVTENICEGLSKVGYLSTLMEIHEQLFDDVAKTARRLQELCTYMSAVWDASSDVVIVCSKHDELVNAAISPSFFQMGDSNGIMAKKPPDDPITLVMEVDPYEGSYNTFEADLSKQMTREQIDEMLKRSRNKPLVVTPLIEKNLSELADLVGDAFAYAMPEGKNQHIMLKSLYRIENGCMQHNMHCEAKIVNLKGKAVLILLRDMTQRFKLHKAETKLINEINKRKIESDANRSDREKLKFGVSTAIDLLDALKGDVVKVDANSVNPASLNETSGSSVASVKLEKLDEVLRTMLTSGKLKGKKK